MFEPPVLVIVFNRLETAKQLMQRLREVQPATLFIASDGPRFSVAGEKEKVEAVRDTLIGMIDWPCEVHRLFMEENLGCGKGPAEAISWFFSHVEQGIILEDDVLPDASFFSFAEAMLQHYRDDEEVMHINAQNFQFGKKRGSGSYYFSRYPLVWGWATWRRAWQYFDFNLSSVSPEDVANMPAGYIDAYNYMTSAERNVWDYQWTFAIWKHKGKCIVPRVNLVKNIGFGEGATHTNIIPHWYKKIEVGAIEKIIHPATKKIDEEADAFYIKKIVEGKENLLSLHTVRQKLSSLKGKINARFR